MNDTLQNIQSGSLQSMYPTFIGVFVLLTIVIGVLSLAIIMQSKKIKYLQKPKYGFLGKPIAVVMILAVIGSSYGLIFYVNQAPQTINNANADIDVKLTITTKSQGDGTYKINVIPNINDQDWGGDNKNSFNVQWTIANSNVIFESESGISKDNPGGIIKVLSKGTYTIKASVTFKSKTYSNQVILKV